MKSLMLLALGMLPMFLLGQSLQREVIGASGTNTVSAQGVMASQTVGQTVLGSFDGPSIRVSTGYQYGDVLATSIPELEDLADIAVYPNPVAHILHVEVESDKALLLQLQVMDVRGRQTAVPTTSMRVAGQATATIDCSQLAVGTYLLRVMNAKSGTMTSYKIQKVQ